MLLIIYYNLIIIYKIGIMNNVINNIINVIIIYYYIYYINIL